MEREKKEISSYKNTNMQIHLFNFILNMKLVRKWNNWFVVCESDISIFVWIWLTYQWSCLSMLILWEEEGGVVFKFDQKWFVGDVIIWYHYLMLLFGLTFEVILLHNPWSWGCCWSCVCILLMCRLVDRVQLEVLCFAWSAAVSIYFDQQWVEQDNHR